MQSPGAISKLPQTEIKETLVVLIEKMTATEFWKVQSNKYMKNILNGLTHLLWLIQLSISNTFKKYRTMSKYVKKCLALRAEIRICWN